MHGHVHVRVNVHVIKDNQRLVNSSMDELMYLTLQIRKKIKITRKINPEKQDAPEERM